MISRLHRVHTATLAGAAAVVLCLFLVSLGCSTAGVTPTTQPASPSTAGATTESTSPSVTVTTTQPAVQSTETSMTQSTATFSVGDIEAQCRYTSELITILYPLYGSKLDDFVSVKLHNKGAVAARVVVKSEIVGYTNQAIDTVDVPAGEALDVGQNPLLIPAVIDDLNVEKPAQVHVNVAVLEEGVEKTVLDETAQTIVMARRDYPMSIEGFSQAEAFEFLAAMVTPNDPSVEALIRKAADYTDSGAMWNGYGGHVGDDNGGVWDRLQAIWQAENDYDLTYVSTWVSFAPGEVQRIRLPSEVLDQQGGNCIELAMLYASSAEALGLEAALILIPGHAFVAVRTDQENADYYFVETTMIGHASFSDAVTKAGSEFDEALPHISAGEESYGWVKIWDARDDGILPLPWK
jgi:hypothetical protein